MTGGGTPSRGRWLEISRAIQNFPLVFLNGKFTPQLSMWMVHP
jgi:hypothetical protein